MIRLKDSERLVPGSARSGDRSVLSVALGLALAVSLTNVNTASAHYGVYPNWRCPAGTSERYAATTLAVRPLNHLTFYSLNSGAGFRVVRVGWSARSLICNFHAYLTLSPTVDVTTLAADEALVMQVFWKGSDGVWHSTHHTTMVFPYRNYVYNTYYPQTALYDLGATEHFVQVRVRLVIIKNNYEGTGLSFYRNVYCPLGSTAYPGSC